MKMPWRRQKIDISVQPGVTMGVAGSEAAGVPSTEAGVIELQGVECSYPGSDAPAISEFNLLVKPGEFVSILGRSGAGKTTALRVVAGFERVSSGYVRVGGQLVGSSFVHVPPDQRRIGLVFQDYALFPHLTVAKNVEFGLKGLPAEERRVRIAPVLKMVGMSGYESRYVHELSGGQQQRVAIARALAPDPVALLLDEPFSNLDRQLRAALRRDIKRIVRESGATTLLVTHDREEALATSDRVAVMGENSIEQIGTPEEVYKNPASAAVAKLIGPCELIPGVFRGGVVVTEAGVFPTRVTTDIRMADGQQALALMRASELEIVLAGEEDQRTSTVEMTEFEGEFTEYSIRLDSGTLLRVRRRAEDSVDVGSRVTVHTRGDAKVIVFPV
ncbi:MAG: ABC transporter ATP-binding protein [Chloroflexi bacterium]|jgi:iron(III) transport system ATP-binding protein|nr:ABC transporter ATP-binding protein [Chloroflexota bacterium]MDA1281456.1 ABC transporter ATP-binding protein [Chloroflexota bacterium]